MITLDTFHKQKNNGYNFLFYLLTGNKNNPRFVLKKFNFKDYDEFLKYNVSSFKPNKKNKLIKSYPILEQVKFKELIMDLPVKGIDEMDYVRNSFIPSGTIVKKMSDRKRKVWSYSGFMYVKKFRLLIPEKCFVNKK